MLKISKTVRDQIVNYISNSTLPAVDAIKIIQALNSLENIDEPATNTEQR